MGSAVKLVDGFTPARDDTVVDVGCGTAANPDTERIVGPEHRPSIAERRRHPQAPVYSLARIRKID